MLSRSIAALTCLGLIPAGTAVACPFEISRYTQPGTGWEMFFAPRARDTAANQTHAFTLIGPDGKLAFRGAIYTPNGFTPAWGVLDRADCSVPEEAKGDELNACQLWEGPVYSNSEAGMDWIAGDDTPAARQILLPGFGSSWWYSELRDPDNVPLDVFTLRGCSS